MRAGTPIPADFCPLRGISTEGWTSRGEGISVRAGRLPAGLDLPARTPRIVRVLDADDPLPPRPRRVLVAGLSASGKTTLARALGERLGLPHVELDALHHGPGWVPRPAFLDDVRSLAAREEWVCEWQYGTARPLLLPRADLLVWLDLPFALVLGRLVRRTLRRRWRGEVLWNGNTEPPLRTILTDPEHVVRYMVVHRHRYDDLVPATVRERPDLPVVRLRRPAQVRAWLARW